MSRHCTYWHAALPAAKVSWSGPAHHRYLSTRPLRLREFRGTSARWVVMSIQGIKPGGKKRLAPAKRSLCSIGRLSPHAGRIAHDGLKLVAISAVRAWRWIVAQCWAARWRRRCEFAGRGSEGAGRRGTHPRPPSARAWMRISKADAAMSRWVISAGLKLIVVPVDSTWMRRSVASGSRARASHASRARAGRSRQRQSKWAGSTRRCTRTALLPAPFLILQRAPMWLFPLGLPE
jgi:hypothetical protein